MPQLSYPSSYFDDFLSYFGVNLFAIWKAMLLQKRVLIYAHPPAGHICQLGQLAN